MNFSLDKPSCQTGNNPNFGNYFYIYNGDKIICR